MTPSGHTVHMITTRAPRGAGQEQVRVSPPRAGFDGARARSGTWEPLAGDALLDRVRHTGRARPMVDPVLADGLRSYLQRGLDDLTGAVPTDLAERVLVVTKDGLANSLSCPTHRESAPYGERPFTLPLACAVLVGLVFRRRRHVRRLGRTRPRRAPGPTCDLDRPTGPGRAIRTAGRSGPAGRRAPASVAGNRSVMAPPDPGVASGGVGRRTRPTCRPGGPRPWHACRR